MLAAQPNSLGFSCYCSYGFFVFVFVFAYDFLLLMFLLFLLLPFLLAGIFELARAGNIAQRCRGLCWCCVYLLCFTLFCFVSYYTFLHRVFVFILPAFLFLFLFLLLLRIVVFVFAFAFYKQTLFVLCRFFSCENVMQVRFGDPNAQRFLYRSCLCFQRFRFW